jgi:hypothetical protein
MNRLSRIATSRIPAARRPKPAGRRSGLGRPESSGAGQYSQPMMDRRVQDLDTQRLRIGGHRACCYLVSGVGLE